MKCKRIIKVVGALALTAALLVSSAVVSFADAYYTTTTKYLDQNTIEVTSKATGLAEGNMATYVAYNGEFSDANAVYIDQKTADSTGTVEFVYQADSDNVKATVKFGGSTESEAQDADEVIGYKVNLTINGTDYKTVTVATVDENYTDEYLAREFEIELASGKVVKSVAVNGTTAEAWYVKNGTLVIYDNLIKADNATVAIEVEDVATPSVTLGTVTGVAGKITAYAKATYAGEDYGVLIKNGDTVDADNTVSYADAADYAATVKLPALGKGSEGGFCVEVEDSLITAGTYSVAAYAGDEESAVKTIIVE